jgi:DNA-binding PadR family transcriptional regulator
MSTYEGFGRGPWRGPSGHAAHMTDGGHGRARRHGGHGRGHGPGHGHGTPGFGPGMPWDPRGGFGPGFRPPFRGRKAARGDVRASVLALLAEQPMHGYQIITQLAERSNGAWRPSPGSVYPVLQQLQDEGLVRIEETDGRRVVHLTDAGRAYVDAHQDELSAPWETVGGQPDEPTADLMGAVRGVAGAAWQVAQVGNTTDLERATRLLTEVRRRLYGILAGDPDDPAPTTDTGQQPAE